MRTKHDRDALLHTAATVAATLRAAGVPFAVTGGLAVDARGGPVSDHDVDILVRPEDVSRAVGQLIGAGMRAARCPEDWLAKVYDGDVLVDLIHHRIGRPVTDEFLARAGDLRVGSMIVPVEEATDLLVDRLMLLGPHRCDLAEPLILARALREQIDWPCVAATAEDSPYAEAFLVLARRLGIDSAPTRQRAPGAT